MKSNYGSMTDWGFCLTLPFVNLTIFGISELDELIRLVNYIILYGKLYTNKQRTNSKKLTPAEFF